MGVFGGTFDPIHIGHLCIAEEARISLCLEQVLFVPACVSPFKLGQVLASAEDRLNMVKLAISDNPGFNATRLEIDRPAPSYTVDTLRQLHTQYGDDTALYLIMGGDSLVSIAAWRQASALIELAHIAVYPRPFVIPDLALLEHQLPGFTAALVTLDGAGLEISATDIRGRVQNGRTIRYLVPAAVESYIREHGLYRAERKGVPNPLLQGCS
jgi:nicotinate-nucleotide adenylyltransferase